MGCSRQENDAVRAANDTVEAFAVNDDLRAYLCKCANCTVDAKDRISWLLRRGKWVKKIIKINKDGDGSTCIDDGGLEQEFT